MSKVKCAILNRNYPPASGITGHSAAELAEYLILRNIDVHVIAASRSYSGGGFDQKECGNIHLVKGIYSGKVKIIRLIANVIEGILMLKKATSLNIDIAICMTDPPLLNLWAGLFLNRKKIKWIYWSMDLYPEAFLAGNLVEKNNFIYRLLVSEIKKNPPNFLLALGDAQMQYILKKYEWKIPAVILPCGIAAPNKLSDPPWIQGAKGKIIIGYVGNLGEAHDANFVYEVIRKIDPSKHLFILSVYGAKAAWLINKAKSHPGIVFVESISQSHLGYIDVHLITLKNNWTHVCVPSKAFTAVSKGSSILYCGEASGDNWLILSSSGWLIDVNGNMQDQINEWIINLSHNAVFKRKLNTANVSANLLRTKLDAFEKIYKYVLNDINIK